MKNHEGCIRGFVWNSKAWYNETMNRITVGMYSKEYDGDYSTTGEFSLIWEELGSNDLCCQLRVWDDAWHALAYQFNDLLLELAELDCENPTEKEVIEILLKLGVKDLTHYTREGECGVKPTNEKLYYIQTAGYLGDAMLWWKPEGRGYTTEIDKAGKFTEEKMREIINNRPDEDIAWECDYIDNHPEAIVRVVYPKAIVRVVYPKMGMTGMKNKIKGEKKWEGLEDAPDPEYDVPAHKYPNQRNTD